MSKPAPQSPRQFAVEVVRRLRATGFLAYWAGGCVRDRLMGREPEDYDVATSATPDEIRRVFGRRRTLAVGAAFGVITVLGPPGAGQIEVATFRSDRTYSDGRHPDEVVFSSPEEDASRRDFTINGLFYDPIDDRVIDFVGGREDLARRVLRAIGDPRERFAEDKLRLLRAVRFAARFDFAIEGRTLQAVREMAAQITAVSPERIAAEVQAMLVDPRRAVAVRLLVETGLARAVLPEIVPDHPDQPRRLDQTLRVLEQLREPEFALALAALLRRWVEAPGAEGVCRRWRLSNRHTDRVRWLVDCRKVLEAARSKPWSQVQRVLAAEGAEDLVALVEAEARAGLADPDQAAWCRARLAWPREKLDPPPLLTGDDLKSRGLPPGPLYKTLLDRVRDAQLDGEIHRPDEALRLVDRLVSGAAAHEKE